MTRITIDDKSLSSKEDQIWLDVLKNGESRLSVCLFLRDTDDGERLICEMYREPRVKSDKPMYMISADIEEIK